MENKIIRKTRTIKLLCFFLFCLGGLPSCIKSNNTYNKQVEYTHNWMKKFASVKNPIKYKPLIKEEVKYFHAPAFKDNSLKLLKASKLRLAYSRLFVIENAIGDKYQADIYFRKAQYWELISMECSEFMSSKELDEHSKLTKEQVIKSISTLNPEFYNKIQELKKDKNQK